MPSDLPEQECLLLESRGSEFALVRLQGGKRSEFYLTLADLVCLSHIIHDKIQSSCPGTLPRTKKAP